MAVNYSVITKLVNSSTMTASDISTDLAFISNTDWLLFIFTCSKDKYDVGVSQVTISFCQMGIGSPSLHLFQCDSSFSLISNEITITKSRALSASTYTGDVTSLIEDNFDGTQYFLLKCNTSATIYTHKAQTSYKPKLEANTIGMENEAYLHLANSKSVGERIGKVDFNLDLFSGQYNLSIPITHFSDAVLDLDICLCYDSTFSDSNSYNSGFLSTGFPKGWKLNVQQFLYQASNKFVYVDQDNKKHVFKLMEGSADTYFDTFGSYLTLKHVSGHYNIYFPNGGYYTFSNGKLTSMNLYRGGLYITINLGYNINNGKLNSVSYFNTTILEIDYGSSYVALYPFGDSTSTNSIILNVNSNNCLSFIDNLDSSDYSFSYLNSSNAYLLSSITFGDKSFNFAFSSESKLLTLSIVDDSTCLGVYEFVYGSNSTLVAFSPYNNTSLTTNTLYQFDNDRNIVEESLIADNQIQRSKRYHFGDRFNYTLDTCSARTPSLIKDSNNNVLDLEITPQSISSTTLYFQINAQDYKLYYSFLYFELAAQLSSSIAVSISLYTIKNNVEALFYSESKSLSYVNSLMFPFFIPIFSERLTSADKLKIVISKTGTVSLDLLHLRLYIFNSAIDYIKTDLSNSSYISSYVVDKDSNPMIFSPSFYKTIYINGNTRSFDIRQEDSLSILTYSLLDKYYLFYKNGEECLLLTSTQFADTNLRYMSISDYHYTIDGKYQNYINDTNFTALYVVAIYLSNVIFLTTEKIRCDFDPYQPNDKIEKTRIDNLFNVVDEVDEFGKTTANTHTTLGRLEYSIKTSGSRSLKSPVYTHSSNRTISAETTSSGNLSISTTYGYDSRLRLSSETLSNHNAVTYSYDNRDNIVGVSQSSKNNAISTSDGRIDTLSSNSSNSFSFTYEPTTTYTYWNGNTFIETSNDGTGYYTKSININGDNITYKYDKFNRLISETHSVNYRVINYLYSDISNGSKLIEILATNENNSTIFDYYYTYDSYGRLVASNYNQYPRKVVFYNPTKDNYDIDKTYRIKNEYVNNYGGHSEYISTRFDKSQGVYYKTTFNGSSSDVIHVSFLEPTYASNLYYEDIYVNGAATTFTNLIIPLISNNQEAPLISESEFKIYTGNAPVSKITSYSYGGDGNISSIAYPYFSTGITYTYNAYDELISENNPYFGNISYSYDVQGNLSSIVRNNITTSISYDSYNKITSASVGGSTYSFSYNSYGYPTTYKGNVMSYSGNNVLRYGNTYFTYDVLGRRTSKYIDNNNKTDYFFVDDHLFMERKCISGTWFQSSFIYGSTGIIGIKIESNIYIYQKDILGNIIALYDEDGNFVSKYIYDAYGNHVVLDNSNNVITSLSHPGNLNPFRYRGYYYDTETGLYNLGYRFYDPELGRFVTPDTFAYLEPNKINGTNLYSYCYGNPIRYVDKDGHSVTAVVVGAIIGAIIAGGVVTASIGWATGNEILMNVGDSIVSGGEIALGTLLMITGVGNPIGMALFSAGFSSFTSGLINMSSGGSYNAGWVGGEISGLTSGFHALLGVGGAFAGSIVTDLIDKKFDTNISFVKAGWSAGISLGLSMFGGIVSSNTANLGKALYKSSEFIFLRFILSYESSVLGIISSTVNAFWPKESKK